MHLFIQLRGERWSLKRAGRLTSRRLILATIEHYWYGLNFFVRYTLHSQSYFLACIQPIAVTCLLVEQYMSRRVTSSGANKADAGVEEGGYSRLYCLSFLRSVPRLSPSICEACVWLPCT